MRLRSVETSPSGWKRRQHHLERAKKYRSQGVEPVLEGAISNSLRGDASLNSESWI